MLHRRNFLITSALALGLPHAWAQTTWPHKPVRVVIPYAAGGVTDSVGRKLVEKWAARWVKVFLWRTKAVQAARWAWQMWPKPAPTATRWR